MRKLFIMTSLTLACEAGPQVTYPSNPNYYNYTPDQNVPFHRLTRADEKISNKIKKKLKIWLTRGYEGQVKFDVINGNVTLTGEVDSMRDKDDIEQKVREAEGVKTINNQISVRRYNW